MAMNKEQLSKATPCPPKPLLRDRPLIPYERANQLKGVFKVLANETRLRLLHALVRGDEMCVTDLAKSLAMKPQAISNQLQRLADRGIIRSRRNGNNIHYRIVDPCVLNLLEYGLCLMEDTRQSTRL